MVQSIMSGLFPYARWFTSPYSHQGHLMTWSTTELVSFSDTHSAEGLGKETKTEEQISQFSLFLEPVLSKGCTWGGVDILWLK